MIQDRKNPPIPLLYKLIYSNRGSGMGVSADKICNLARPLETLDLSQTDPVGDIPSLASSSAGDDLVVARCKSNKEPLLGSPSTYGHTYDTK
jgi:hypothetical protein